MTSNITTGVRGRPKDPDKGAAILKAAKALFLSGGFSGTSMDAIAQQAGVSKLTVYSHFCDKETLFSTVIESECSKLISEPIFELNPELPLRTTLIGIGRAFLALLSRQDVIKLERLMCSLGGQDTEMSRLYFEAGPQHILNAVISLIHNAQQRELLLVAEPRQVAESLLALLLGLEHLRTLTGNRQPMNASEAHLHVERAVDTFLRAYSVAK
ncbi:MAG: TetR/AcrR family transcriptional regulator [Parahaliea sp.]